MQDNHSDNYDETTEESPLKVWLEENLRMLLSILIVVAIAGGIYSYSQRSQSPTVTATVKDVPSALLDKLVSDTADKDAATTSVTDSAKDKQSNQNDAKALQDKIAPAVTSIETSKETETAFVESAQKGEGVTHLARRAVADYLDKNPDSSLTLEHKVYIEDYLRKNVKTSHNVALGSSVEFSKTLIQTAIEQSKHLNEKQLKNLHKYVVGAPSLR
jgi:hypothetical protein